MTLSKNICLLAIGFSIISAQPSIAQKEILFQVKFKPNKTYVTDMVNNIRMEMDFDVDPAKKKEMEGTGMKLPMQMNMLQDMRLSTKTGAMQADKRIPMTMTYDKVGITMTMNGNEMKQPDKFAGMTIKAYATEGGKVSIDTIEGNTDEATKAGIQKMVSDVLKAVEFPNKALKIGDTFTQEVPMEMPVSGTILNMLVNATYTLKEIKGTQALFDYTQTVDMNMKMEKGNSSAKGSGKGTMVYDMPANYITDTTGDMSMNMSMNMGEMVMKMNLTAKTSVKAKVL
ncbi:hypothetical protein ACFSJU_12100 [Paradesertivirga mongoliensis]|uniref:DUF4412 domain-containing protein n=1 Tax=Paradesertivirga mongoliensis TaxID=2100740 RepID=A0ABW4ZM13_9SPHI|nr:hypothetical protein [Pedobacter mongoliensis]